MLHRKRVLLLVIALAVAPPAHAQTNLRYQFKEKDRLVYTIEQKTNSKMTLMGADIVSTINANMSLYWEVLSVNSQGSAQVRVKVTHSRLALDSLLGMVEVDSKNKDGPSDAAGKMLAQ